MSDLSQMWANGAGERAAREAADDAARRRGEREELEAKRREILARANDEDREALRDQFDAEDEE